MCHTSPFPSACPGVWSSSPSTTHFAQDTYPYLPKMHTKIFINKKRSAMNFNIIWGTNGGYKTIKINWVDAWWWDNGRWLLYHLSTICTFEIFQNKVTKKKEKKEITWLQPPEPLKLRRLTIPWAGEDAEQEVLMLAGMWTGINTLGTTSYSCLSWPDMTILWPCNSVNRCRPAWLHVYPKRHSR